MEHSIQKKETSDTQSFVNNTKSLITVSGSNYILQESDEISLLTSTVSDDTLQHIAMSICLNSRLSTHTTEGEISGINNISPVKELRYIKSDSESAYYCIYQGQDGGRLYVLFNEKYYFWTRGVLYTEKQLSFDDFSSLKEGISTREDVAKIDSSINAGIKQSYDKIDEIVQDNKTFHMTIEGYVEITYTKEGIIKKLLTKENDLIQSINKNDLVNK